MVQRILSWRLLKLGYMHANVTFDQRNSFGSMDWGTLDKAVGGLLNKKDVDLGGAEGLLVVHGHRGKRWRASA